MQGNTRQKARRSMGSDRGDGISVEPPEGASPVPPLARIVVFGIRHGHTGRERREDNCRRSKCLMRVDGQFVADGDSLQRPPEEVSRQTERRPSFRFHDRWAQESVKKSIRGIFG